MLHFPEKMFAGGEDERLHGLGRVEVAQVAAQHLEGEGGFPLLFNSGDFDVCDDVQGDLQREQGRKEEEDLPGRQRQEIDWQPGHGAHDLEQEGGERPG